MNKEFIYTEELNRRIFTHFEGMDNEYEKLIREYHTTFLNENYTLEHKNRERLLTIDKIKELKVDRINKAKEEIESIKAEYTSLPEPKKVTPEERTANILLWTKILPTSTIDELVKLWADNSTDEDLKKLLKAELRERTEGQAPTPKVSQFLHDLENEVSDTRFKELDKLVIGFNTWANMSNYPANIKDSLANVKYRTVEKDLERYPIDNGTIKRPVFGII